MATDVVPIWNFTDRDARHRFYCSRVWLQFRALHLRAEPLCRRCKEVQHLVPATHVDHVVALVQGGAPLDEDNVQSLCQPCHAQKTRVEEQLGQPRRVKGCDANGVPLDPAHHWHDTAAPAATVSPAAPSLPAATTRPAIR